MQHKDNCWVDCVWGFTLIIICLRVYQSKTRNSLNRCSVAGQSAVIWLWLIVTFGRQSSNWQTLAKVGQMTSAHFVTSAYRLLQLPPLQLTFSFSLTHGLTFSFSLFSFFLFIPSRNALVSPSLSLYFYDSIDVLLFLKTH